jgi:hypothetical protein
MGPSVVVIARPEHEIALRKRLGIEPSVRLFSEYDVLKAFETITDHAPKILALDRGFAVTPRAAALVARLKADPHLQGVDLRVLAEDETHAPVLLSTRGMGLEGAIFKTSHPLDYCGTRRAPRFALNDDAAVVVNGERGRLVNLSATGAQLLVVVRLRPEEPLRLSLVDADTEVKVRGVVAWSSAEPTAAGLSYRAGIEFTSADSLTLDAFCTRHVANPDPSGRAA